jgi:hypothetical protein
MFETQVNLIWPKKVNFALKKCDFKKALGRRLNGHGCLAVWLAGCDTIDNWQRHCPTDVDHNRRNQQVMRRKSSKFYIHTYVGNFFAAIGLRF